MEAEDYEDSTYEEEEIKPRKPVVRSLSESISRAKQTTDAIEGENIKIRADHLQKVSPNALSFEEKMRPFEIFSESVDQSIKSAMHQFNSKKRDIEFATESKSAKMGDHSRNPWYTKAYVPLVAAVEDLFVVIGFLNQVADMKSKMYEKAKEVIANFKVDQMSGEIMKQSKENLDTMKEIFQEQNKQISDAFKESSKENRETFRELINLILNQKEKPKERRKEVEEEDTPVPDNLKLPQMPTERTSDAELNLEEQKIIDTIREMNGLVKSTNKDEFFGKLHAYNEEKVNDIKRKLKTLARKGHIEMKGHGVSQMYVLRGD